jgi:hypothetical protein
MSDGALPTARTIAPTGFRIHVWCKACRLSVDADLDALIRAGRGDAPLARLIHEHSRDSLADVV